MRKVNVIKLVNFSIENAQRRRRLTGTCDLWKAKLNKTLGLQEYEDKKQSNKEIKHNKNTYIHTFK